MGAWIEIPGMHFVGPFDKSLPPWERGLKLRRLKKELDFDKSLPPWERGLKLLEENIMIEKNIVAPPVGAWIEISFLHSW